MSKRSGFLRSRTRSTFYTSLFIIALVMFLLSLTTGGAIYSNLVLEDAQENFELMVSLPDHVAPAERDALGDFLGGQPFVKEIRYVSKDEAGRAYIEGVGEEFMSLLDGTNPLPASYNFKLRAPWINNDSLEMIHALILEGQDIVQVQDITYPIGHIEQLKENTKLYIRIAVGLGLLVAVIAFFIVNSTIRLAIYGKRLMIRSMQLIGAKSRFIRSPFVRMGVKQGFLGALIAVTILVGVVFAADRLGVVAIKELLFRLEFMIMLGGILIFGTFLGWLSSSWAVNRFLNKNLDQLM